MLKFNIHGVKIEIRNENKQSREYLLNEYEYFLYETNIKPDITLNFVPHIPIASKSNYVKNIINNGTIAFGNHNCVINLKKGRVSVPFQNIGGSVEIKLEKTVPVDRIFDSIIEPTIYYKLLTRNLAFIHSSAIYFNKMGIIFPAWTYAGKTELLLKFMENGAKFIADDWTIVSASGEIYAYPRSIRIRSHSIKFFPGIKKLNQQKLLWDNSKLRKGSIQNISEGWQSFSVFDLFSNDLIQKKCDLNIIAHLIRYRGKMISLEEVDSTEIIERINSTTNYLRSSNIQSFYNIYQLIFPQKKPHIIESVTENERSIITSAFEDKRIFSLKIPLVTNPSSIWELMRDKIFDIH